MTAPLTSVMNGAASFDHLVGARRRDLHGGRVDLVEWLVSHGNYSRVRYTAAQQEAQHAERPVRSVSLRGKRRLSDVDAERARLLEQYPVHRSSADAET